MSRPQMLPPMGTPPPPGGPPPGPPAPPWVPPTSSNPEEFRKRFNANDWRGVEEILRKNPALLNVPDADGMTPLQMAIADGNVDMLIELLKRHDLKMGDALLHAVGKGDRILVELVIVAMKKRGLPMDVLCETTTHFKCYMTPLMLACLNENYDLVGLFLRDGHVLPIPHGAQCGCPACVGHHQPGERLEDKMRRVDCYAAASSLAFVLQQDDPFDYAMSFSRFLEKCKGYDPSYALKYDDMIQKLNAATVSLVSDCDKQEVIETVLKRGHKGVPKEKCVFGFPRVQEALRSRQKLFLAQPSCQSVIYSAYLGTWNDQFGLRRGWRILRWLSHTICYPVMAIIFLFSCGKFPASFKNPTCRFISSFSSYITFLAALIFFTQYKEDRSHLGMPSLIPKQVALGYIYCYLTGMWAVVLTDFSRYGVQRYFSVWWRTFDLAFLIIWAATFYAYLEAISTAAFQKVDFLHRVHWRPAEPQLVYEIWFTWAAIMSSVRLFYYGQVLSHFGVVTISICRCVPTILRYVVVLFVVLVSFAVGLNHMYEHYKHNVVVRDDKEVSQPFQLTSFFTAARYLYWAYYGYLPPDTYGVIVGNVGHGHHVVEKKHDLISNTGELMSGVYHVIELVILLNLMVSIMTAAAVSVVDKEQIEWKFVCTEIWMEWFQDSRVLPLPFNLFQFLIHGVIYLFRKCARRKGPLSAWDFKHQVPPEDPKGDLIYKQMVTALKDRLRMKLDSGALGDVFPTAAAGGGGPKWTKAGKGCVSRDLLPICRVTGSCVTVTFVYPLQLGRGRVVGCPPMFQDQIDVLAKSHNKLGSRPALVFEFDASDTVRMGTVKFVVGHGEYLVQYDNNGTFDLVNGYGIVLDKIAAAIMDDEARGGR